MDELKRHKGEKRRILFVSRKTREFRNRIQPNIHLSQGKGNPLPWIGNKNFLLFYNDTSRAGMLQERRKFYMLLLLRPLKLLCPFHHGTTVIVDHIHFLAIRLFRIIASGHFLFPISALIGERAPFCCLNQRSKALGMVTALRHLWKSHIEQ